MPAGGPNGTLLLNDNFDDNDISDWEAATGTVSVGSGIVTVTMSGGGADRIRKINLTSGTEYWASYREKLRSGHSGWTNAENTQGCGITKTSSFANLCYVGIINVSGVFKWRVRYWTDAGVAADLATSDVTITEDVFYDVVLHFKAATGVGANNGIAQAWVNQVSIGSKTDIDSDTLTADAIIIGNNNVDPFDAIVDFDDVKASLTGTEPAVDTGQPTMRRWGGVPFLGGRFGAHGTGGGHGW